MTQVVAICLAASLAQQLSGFPVGPWEISGQAATSLGGRCSLYLVDLPRLRGSGTIECLVAVERDIGRGGWRMAGLALALGTNNYWRLGLVIGPDGRRYTELIENYMGVHQAQTRYPTRLVPIEGARGGTWQLGRRYRLRIELTPQRIVGEVIDAESGQVIARHGWILDPQVGAVRGGWAAFMADGVRATFSAPAVRPGPYTPPPALEGLPTGRRGCIGIFTGFGADQPLAALEAELRRRGFAVARLQPDEIATRSLPYPTLRALVGDFRSFPAPAAESLLDWMSRGGLLVSAAAPAFSKLLYPLRGRWVPWSEFVQFGVQRVSGARAIVQWTAAELSKWAQGGGGGFQGRAELSIAPKATPDGQDALCIKLGPIAHGWWTVGRRFENPPIKSGELLTCFWARGDGQTPEMSVEWAEQDGSRWIAVISLTKTWRFYALPPQAFRYWPDNPSKGRGGPGDRLRPENAVRLIFGFSQTHTRSVLLSRAESHQVFIGPVQVARAAERLEGMAPVQRPAIEGVSPGYKLHYIPQARRIALTDHGRLIAEGARPPALRRAAAPIWRPVGAGFNRGYFWRFIPLLQAIGPGGRGRGYPAAMFISRMVPLPNCVWISLGALDAKDLRRADVQRFLAAAISGALDRPLLIEAGARHFLWRPGEPIKLGALATTTSVEPQQVEVRFKLYDSRGRPAAPVIKRQLLARPGRAAIATAELSPLQKGEYTLRTELCLGGRVVDFITQPLQVRARPQRLAAESVVRRDGPQLTLGGKPWHPFGCNFWPHFMGGLPGGAYWRNWLDPCLYDPRPAEEDVRQMAGWGFTAIAGVGADIQWPPGEDNPALRDLEDFLWRCDKLGIKVFLFVRGLDPRARNREVAERLIRAVRNIPSLAGYDIAWEPNYYKLRHSFAEAWRRWLELQFGSLQRAERMLGSLPRDSEGRVTTLPDNWLRDGTPSRAAAAAFHAFMNHQLGAEYRLSWEILRRLDSAHLVGFRGSTLHSPLEFKPLAMPAVLHFMDFAGPEGYNVPIYGGLTEYEYLCGLNFAVPFLQLLSGGKPVIWMEFGLPIYPNGTAWRDEMLFIPAERYAYQVEEGRRWWRAQISAGAWGSFVWWYPGGFRVGERSDCGLVEPDNYPRPVAEAASRAARRFAAAGPARPVGALKLRPEANVGWWVGEMLRLREEFGRNLAAGKLLRATTAGLSMTSADCPLIDPAGRKWPGAGPLRYLDAIFARLRWRPPGGRWREVELRPLPAATEIRTGGLRRIELEAWAGNIAEARWLAGRAGRGGVWLEVRLARSGELLARAPLDGEVKMQGRGHFGPVRIDLPAGAAELRLQLSAHGRARFGEILAVKLIG